MRAATEYEYRRCLVRSATDAPAVRCTRSGLRGLGIRRGAFTIFEMILVLAVLATIIGLLWPALDNLHTEYRLRQGGALVQARMAGARVHAVDWGVPYQFRYEPGGQRFLVLPFDQQLLSGQSQATGSGRKPPRVAGTLPSAQASFDATGTGASAAQPVPAEWLAGLPDAENFSGVAWSAPILFYPDGSAGTARIVIRDTKSRIVTVSVRALTGSVSVSKIENGATR